jgi:uncharacterized membrane protein
MKARSVARAGVIAAVYAAFTLIVLQVPGLGVGPVQLRLSEALTVLAVLTPAAIPGLWIGSMIANAFMLTTVGPLGLLDVVFGSLGTLLGAMWSWKFRKRAGIALLGPVFANALIVPAYLPVMLKGLGFYRVPILGIDLEGHYLAMYLFGFVAVAIGQALVVYVLGLPLLIALKELKVASLLRDEG